jgi:hypothetical protein
MTNEQMDHNLEEARVGAFLAPLAKVSAATRSTMDAPAPLRLRRVALAAVALVALGAGVAVAATTTSNEAKQVTVVEPNGEAHQGVLCVVQGDGDILEHRADRIQPGDPCPSGTPSTGRTQRHQSD